MRLKRATASFPISVFLPEPRKPVRTVTGRIGAFPLFHIPFLWFTFAGGMVRFIGCIARLCWNKILKVWIRPSSKGLEKPNMNRSFSTWHKLQILPIFSLLEQNNLTELHPHILTIKAENRAIVATCPHDCCKPNDQNFVWRNKPGKPCCLFYLDATFSRNFWFHPFGST